MTFTIILLSRVILGSILSGNVSSFIYSLCGGLFCLAGMLILRKIIDKRQIWLCSVFGAVFHNIGQTVAAIFMMKTTAVIAYMPFLLIFGCIAGAFTGLCAQFFVSRSDISITNQSK